MIYLLLIYTTWDRLSSTWVPCFGSVFFSSQLNSLKKNYQARGFRKLWVARDHRWW